MVTASIVVHNTPREHLQHVLTLLSASEVSKIFIIDNSPSDTLKDISGQFEKAIYQKVKNQGFGAGHNIAIKQAVKLGADFHLVLNADVSWTGNVITDLRNYLQDNPKVGLVAPKILYPDGQLQFSCRLLPSPTDLFFKRFLPKKVSHNRMRRYLLKDFDHSGPINCPYLLGAFLFFRIDALKQTGLFDERFFLYPEDIDITRRIHENWETVYLPYVTITHVHDRASSKNLRLFFIHLFNMIKYFNKWGWSKDLKREKYNNRLLDYLKNIHS